MDRNVSQQREAYSSPLLIIVISVALCSPEKNRFWVAMRTPGRRTISRHRTQIAKMLRIAHAVHEEGGEADLVGVLATRAIEADAVEEAAEMVGEEAEDRTSQAVVIQMLRGHEDTTRRCRRLPDGRDESHIAHCRRRVHILLHLRHLVC